MAHVHAGRNKAIMLKQGVVEAIMPLLEAEADVQPVIFKLLGTLRMLIDGQGKMSDIF